ncbi:hypothetical protein [Komarekiella delphini-convector]|nr:hypothetical protein [Komarekiella delphini-convector]
MSRDALVVIINTYDCLKRLNVLDADAEAIALNDDISKSNKVIAYIN